jgi:hypothetical protein
MDDISSDIHIAIICIFVNVFSQFYLRKIKIYHLHKGLNIINLCGLFF